MDIPTEVKKIRSEMKADRKIILRALETQWTALQDSIEQQHKVLQEHGQVLLEQRKTLSDFINRSAVRQEHFLDLLEFQAKETDDLHFRVSRLERKLDPPAA